MFCKHWLTFPRKVHVGQVQNRTGVNFRTRTKFTEPILQLLNIPIPWYGHLHITVIHSSFCKAETATRLLKFFSFIFARVFSNRFSSPKSKSFLGVWYFPILSTPVHLYYRPQIKSIHVFKRIILVKLVHCENKNARSENFCQVMFYCSHFYCVRIEPHCKHRSIEFLTTQTDQPKRDILIMFLIENREVISPDYRN